MKSLLNPGSSGRILAVLTGALLVYGCVNDANYDLNNLKDIDETITVFGDGLQLPLGQTDSIVVGDLLKNEGLEALDSILKKDKYGNYSIAADGSYNMDEIISDLHLEKLGDINGASFKDTFSYKIGDFNPDQFKIEGKEISCESEIFEDFNLDDIPMPTIKSEQVISTGMYKYMPSDDDLDIGKRLGKMEHLQDILSISELADSIPSYIPGTQELPVQEYLEHMQKASFKFEYSSSVDTTISLGESCASQVADIKNFTLQSGGQLLIELEAVNCPLTKGSIKPGISVDMSSMFNINGAQNGKLDLSEMELTSDKTWKSSKTFTVNSLAAKFPEYSGGNLSLKGLIDVGGTVNINDAKSTPNTVKALADKSMQFKAVISFNGVVLSEMDITLGDVTFNVDDVNVPVSVYYELRKEIASVDTVYFKEDKKLEVKIKSTSLTNLKTIDKNDHISVKPSVEVIFPEGLKVKEAVNGKVVIDGDLFNGEISKMYTLEYIVPNNSKDKKLTFDGNVTARVQASASGSFSSKYLPKKEEDDVKIYATVNCTPALKDYDVTLDKNNLNIEVSEKQPFSFEIEGLDGFGTFNVSLKNSPKATITFDIPTTSELNIVADNLVIAIPEFIKVDGSQVSGFDAVKNTITLNGTLPAKIELPVTSLKVTPQSEGEKTIIKGELSVIGSITVDKYKITRLTFDEMKDKFMKFKAVIPSMEAESIDLEGDFNKSLDYEGKDIVILDSEALKSIPKEVKSVTQLDLEDVNAIIEIKIAGLPDMKGGTFSLKDTKICLPEFLYGENDTRELILDSDIAITEGNTVVQKAQLTKLKNVNLEGVSEIKGDVKFVSSLYSHKPSVDISTLKSTIKATVKIGVGNGESADHPGKIALSKAAVKVGYKMESNQSISFGEIPADLQKEDVNFALNPVMRLELATNFGAPVKGDFVLTPYIGGESLEAVTIKDIELPFSEDWNRTLTNKYVIGSNVKAESDETAISTDLSPLLKRLPDSIVVAINVNIDDKKDCVVYPSATYTCDMKYAFDVPMSFGEDFALNLSADIDSLDDLNQYLEMADGVAALEGAVLSTLPIGLDCSVSLLDSTDREIELTEPMTLKISPTDGVRGNRETFKVKLSLKNPGQDRLKKIRFNFNASASKDVNLKESQFIRVEDVKIDLPKGITIYTQEN